MLSGFLSTLSCLDVLARKLPQATTWKYLNLSLLTMDPLSISASVLTVMAATITTIKTLNETPWDDTRVAKKHWLDCEAVSDSL
ncbi:hypothetical protein DL95DRAFT_396445 [Leptodontidium sp. 2 PMI_412]|nr:hypothetical protein DL95DRAFT_396445 [Leptodontidium sp. 2 PMI_412]